MWKLGFGAASAVDIASRVMANLTRRVRSMLAVSATTAANIVILPVLEADSAFAAIDTVVRQFAWTRRLVPISLVSSIQKKEGGNEDG